MTLLFYTVSYRLFSGAKFWKRAYTKSEVYPSGGETRFLRQRLNTGMVHFELVLQNLYPVGMVTTGAAPFSPVSTRVKTNIKKEKIFFDIRSLSSIQK